MRHFKYSNEHGKQQNKLAYESSAWLVVETLGADGLRYRLRRNERISDWRMLSAFRVASLVDTAGAGDWCTAGIVHVLDEVPSAPKSANEDKVVDAIRYGQAQGGLNCGLMDVVKGKVDIIAYGHEGKMRELKTAKGSSTAQPSRAMRARRGKKWGIKYLWDADRSLKESACYYIRIAGKDVEANKITL